MKRYTFIAIESFVTDSPEQAMQQLRDELSKEHPEYLFEMSNEDELEEGEEDEN